MIARFCLYSVLKNLRFADPFLAIYLLELGFSYAQIGAMLGFEKLITALLEIPSGYIADCWGRRTILACSFACHAVGLSIIALAAGYVTPNPVWFYVGLGIFGVGEAFRTGSHKAIMLDYLELKGLRAQSTSVLALARTFSKASSALAGITAGLLLFLLHDYAILFWLSAGAALAGCTLILSYPKSLEGEASRKRKDSSESFDDYQYRVLSLLRNARLWPLLIQSLIYESQIEVILKLFLQPFLYRGLSAAGFALPSVSGNGAQATGSVLVGVNELIRDTVGAIGANNSGRAERRFRSRVTGLNFIYLASVIALGVLALTAVYPASFLLVGLGAIGAATFLQNLRRPMFVSQLDMVANRPLRATVLSIDSQARSLAVAVQLPLMGLAADAWGLWTVASLSAFLMLAGLISITPYSTDDHNFPIEQTLG